MHDDRHRPGPEASPGPDAATLRALVCGAASALDVDTVAPADALGLLAHWTAIANAATTLVGALGGRAATGAAWRSAGAKDAADWLARKTGTTAAQARDDLATARRLRDLPATDGAARRGELSPAQTAAIADAATVDPAAEQRLLGAAGRESVGELRDRCARTKAAADTDADATRARIHDARCLRRFSTADGLHHLHASGPAEALAAFDAALHPYVEARFTAARTAGTTDPYEARCFDAFTDLVDNATRPASAPGDRVLQDPAAG